MKRMLASAAVVALSGGALALTGTAQATQPDEGATFDFSSWSDYMLVDGHKVTFCHRTGSASNPYVIVTADLAAVNDVDAMESDHQSHEQVGNGLGPDIIPISELVKRNLKEVVPVELCVETPPPSYS